MSKAETANETAVAKRYDDEDLASLTNIEAAIKFLESQGAIKGVTNITDIVGDGFSMSEKKTLVNVPFLMFDCKVVENAEHGEGGFSVVRLITADGRKLVITDGGTGVHRQVQQMIGKNITSGVMCNNGLNVSEYDYTNPDGSITPAKTYYFAL